MQRDPKILNHPGLKPLWNSLERERIQQQSAAIVLIVLGLIVAVVGVLARRMLWPLVGGSVATLALWWFFRLLSEQPMATLHRQLRDDPLSIAWIYATNTERMPFGFKTQSMGTLYLVESNGAIQSFSLKPDNLKLVTKTLNRVLPHAEFGYSEDRELKYRGEITKVRGRGERDIFM